MIKVMYFARLREMAGLQQEVMDYRQEESVSSFVGRLVSERGASWQTLSEACINIAINQQIVDKTCVIQDGDEIAFFPPVTGG